MPHFGEPRMKCILGAYHIGMGVNLTYNFSFGGETFHIPEPDAQDAFPRGRFLSFKLNVNANALTVDMTAVVRVNGADSALILVVPAGATGIFPIRAVVQIAEDDLCNFQFRIPVGAGAIAFNAIAVFEAA